jgi:hypothetical protein
LALLSGLPRPGIARVAPFVFWASAELIETGVPKSTKISGKSFLRHDYFPFGGKFLKSARDECDLMSKQDWHAVFSQLRTQLPIGQHQSENFTYYN